MVNESALTALRHDLDGLDIRFGVSYLSFQSQDSNLGAQFVDSETARDALRAMLHGIFFHRLFGVVKPAKIDCLDVSFPAVKDSETEKLVDDTVLHFLRELQSVPHSKKEGQIEVFFAEKKEKKATWFNSAGEVRITLCLFSMLTFV